MAGRLTIMCLSIVNGGFRKEKKQQNFIVNIDFLKVCFKVVPPPSIFFDTDTVQ